MYQALAEESGGRVLELCAGSGRIAVPLAAAGHDVTAVDIDADMLARARTAWKRHPARKAGGGSLTFIESDATLLDLPDRFDLVILALNSLLLLDGRDAQLAALRVMARHLDNGGRAVVDVWLPSRGDLQLYDGRLMLEWVRRDEATDEWVAKMFEARHDPQSNRAQITTFFDAWRDTRPVSRTMRRDTAHLITRAQLDVLVKRAGLTVLTRAGDYSLAPFHAGDDRVILVIGPGRSYGGSADRA
jgi:SAM-dependent methyltransferase